LALARDNQIGFANRFEESGDPVHPFRVGMYPREAAHIGYVIGQQQAMLERGAKRWRRVLHPELSKTGPCAQCTEDSHTTHPISEPFFEFHPNGVCGIHGVQYSGDIETIELPSPTRDLPTEFLDIVRKMFNNIKQIVRRIRK
jgi:hypothetical protein